MSFLNSTEKCVLQKRTRSELYVAIARFKDEGWEIARGPQFSRAAGSPEELWWVSLRRPMPARDLILDGLLKIRPKAKPNLPSLPEANVEHYEPALGRL